MTEKDGKQYQIVQRGPTGDIYLEHYDTRQDAERAKVIHERWAEASHIQATFEILERVRMMGYPCVLDPKMPHDVIVAMPDTVEARAARRAAERYHLNFRAFEADARSAVLMQMLELAGFPAGSPDFAVLQGQALGQMFERNRADYLAYLDAQAHFEKIKQLESYSAEPTATGATINRQALQVKIDTINRLILEVRTFKKAHPEHMTGYRPMDRGSLLNAYREGDIDFDECVRLMAKAVFPAAEEKKGAEK